MRNLMLMSQSLLCLQLYGIGILFNGNDRLCRDRYYFHDQLLPLHNHHLVGCSAQQFLLLYCEPIVVYRVLLYFAVYSAR